MKNMKLKKKIGEKAYKFLINNYNEDFLGEHLPSLFAVLSDIRHIQESELFKLKILLNSKLEEKSAKKEIKKTAKEMLDEAGFILFDNIHCQEDYLFFEKFYREGEKLCKFYTYDATDEYSRVFWIARKGYENIKPLENPERQDEYGTSLMSVGISKDTKNVIQICNRYNHRVQARDNTYNSNLDNIIDGLTEAFNNDYNLSIHNTSLVEFKNFYFYNNKFFYYFYEINGKKYGNNTIDGIYYDPSIYFIFDNFIINLKEKTIITADNTTDGFIDIFNQKVSMGHTIHIVADTPTNRLLDDTKKIIILK
jgi:hypothetical protein